MAKKKTIIISLGGSVIIPKDVDINFLKKFKEIIKKHKKNYQFVIVTGGGITARKYMEGLEKEGKSDYFKGLIGISITRMNARFMTYLFGKDVNKDMPRSMKEVKNLLKKNNPVFCGGLRYNKKETSDATSAKLARYFNCDFINLTNVDGLYDKDPKKNKNAKLISEISWKEFYKKVNKIKYKPGQHFVLDQKASRTIKKYKIKTYIIGKKLENLNELLNNKDFRGTTIK